MQFIQAIHRSLFTEQYLYDTLYGNGQRLTNYFFSFNINEIATYWGQNILTIRTLVQKWVISGKAYWHYCYPNNFYLN